jgi:hypothetical protein
VGTICLGKVGDAEQEETKANIEDDVVCIVSVRVRVLQRRMSTITQSDELHAAYMLFMF